MLVAGSIILWPPYLFNKLPPMKATLASLYRELSNPVALITTALKEFISFGILEEMLELIFLFFKIFRTLSDLSGCLGTIINFKSGNSILNLQ